MEQFARGHAFLLLKGLTRDHNKVSIYDTDMGFRRRIRGNAYIHNTNSYTAEVLVIFDVRTISHVGCKAVDVS